MKEIVLKYLDETYAMTLSTYVSYKLKDKHKDEEVSLKEVFVQMETIFSINEDEQREIFDLWADKKSIELNNLVVSIQEKLYQLTGKTIQVSPDKMNGLIDEVDVRNETDALLRLMMDFK
jgi:hypothetical protein